MAKLPTTFTKLDLTGFDIDPNKQHSSINREMVDVACAVLQKNRVGVVMRSVQAALKSIYGIGGSADTVCSLLKEWRAENLFSVKQGKGEKDLVSAIVDAADDGLLDEQDIPEEYLTATKQMAIATYRLAYQNADTSVSGDRMKTLAAENDVMKQQLKDFPQLQLELNFYKAEYERQRIELREAYMNLNKQQLVDSDNFRQQLDNLYQERNDLVGKLSEAQKRLAEVADLESRERLSTGEISRINGQLEAREKEISTYHQQIQNLQAQIGEKQVMESQIEQLRSQLKEATLTITRLQAQQKSTSALEVDSFTNTVLEQKVNDFEKELSEREQEISQLQLQLAKLQTVSKNSKLTTANSK
ncbi:hypothetical protein [Microseira sp. BLCC-F43]|jgi:chromosome segregation ATPase|uniref:hypothetical protein n=1 Tax=Microseira sp. BLCC-F43 TaxID=3153602 RepID=UPI0035B9405B